MGTPGRGNTENRPLCCTKGAGRFGTLKGWLGREAKWPGHASGTLGRAALGGYQATGGGRADGGAKPQTRRGAARTLRLTKGRAERHRPAAAAKEKTTARAMAALPSDRTAAAGRAPQLESSRTAKAERLQRYQVGCFYNS